ncbi:MAG: AAA family ATPase [Chloroflexi bacterium]|nr:AAA family ATPase [Chloroflexota bacterium]
MSKTIAIAGKGGTGKTTVSALLIKILSARGTVLAIDGDPSSNLNLALGLPLEETVGAVREDMARQVKRGKFDPGMAKNAYIEYKIHESLVESERIDLLAMGRPEGPGCYCAANNMLRDSIDRLTSNYDFVVIDNEAGMEHISRQTTKDIDVLLIVADNSVRSIITAGRIKELIKEIRTHVDQIALVVNRVDGPLSPEMQQEVEKTGLQLIGQIPLDPNITALDAKGRPVIELPEDSPARKTVHAVARKLRLIED